MKNLKFYGKKLQTYMELAITLQQYKLGEIIVNKKSYKKR